MIKVSVIIPIYDMEKYLQMCLDSVFSQTLKEIEVVCVNDSSTDNSLEILKQFQKLHSNMQIITQENSGAGVARNTGIKASKGEYLQFIDPDDYFASDDALESLYRTAKNAGVDVCGGNTLTLRDGFVTGSGRTRIKDNGFVRFKDYQDPRGHWRYIIKRDLLVKYNIFYPNYRMGEDIVFLTNVLLAVDKFFLIKKDVHVYRSWHKEEKWTAIKVNDVLSAYYETLDLAINNNLMILFDDMVRSVNKYAKRYCYKIIKENNTWDKITMINEVINKGNIIFKREENKGCLLEDELAYEKYLQMIKIEKEKIVQVISLNKSIVIYGAGNGGRMVCRYMRSKGNTPVFFVVSDKSQNPDSVDGIKVIELDELQNAQEYLFVLGIVNIKMKGEIKEHLQNKGYMNILDVDCDSLNDM